MNEEVKVIGIGLNKTGTTTLGICGEILGYRHMGPSRRLLEDVVGNNFEQLEKVLDQYDIFEDWPWPLIYKKIDMLYPGSKFILTTRKNSDIWINSLKKHSMHTHPTKHCRKFAYGYNYPQWHEKEHIEFYENHNEQARVYFKDRPGDFLEICWESGDDWEKLCGFLGKDIPEKAFPHANKANDKEKSIWYYVNKLFSLTGL